MIKLIVIVLSIIYWPALTWWMILLLLAYLIYG